MGRKEKFFLALDMFNSIVMVLLLLVVLSFSLDYYTDNFPWKEALNAKMFYVAIGITFVTVIVQWIDGRIKFIRRIIRKKEVNR